MIDIETRASTSDVRVGDPIELRIELFGDAATESLPPPMLGENAELIRSFRIPDGALSGETHETRKVFTATIRPLRADVTEIPAIEYVMFDPDREKFVTMRSQPIPLTVSPSVELSAGSLSNFASPTALQDTAISALDGLRDIRTDPAALLASQSTISSRQLLAIAAVPPAVFFAYWIGSLGVGLVSADRAGTRRRSAAKNAAARMHAARSMPPRERATQLRAALVTYLSDRFDQPAGRVDGAAGVEFLRSQSIRPELVEEYSAVLALVDQAAFSGFDADADAMARRLSDLIARLERA